MIISKIRGTHRSIPIGKIKLTYLYETIRYLCSIHPLFEESWTKTSTSNPQLCLEVLEQFVLLAASPSCKELGHFLQTLMAVLNHNSYLELLTSHTQLFMKIHEGLQSNPNIATVSKCTIFKVPLNSPFTIKHRWTTYYLLFNFVPVIQSQKFFHNLMEHNNEYSKSMVLFKIFLSVITLFRKRICSLWYLQDYKCSVQGMLFS